MPSVPVPDSVLMKAIDYLFKKYDRDNSGSLDRNELADFFNEVFHILKVPITITKDKAYLAMKIVDKDGDGKASKTEVLNGIKHILGEKQKEDEIKKNSMGQGNNQFGNQANQGAYGNQGNQGNWGNQNNSNHQEKYVNQGGNETWGNQNSFPGNGMNPNGVMNQAALGMMGQNPQISHPPQNLAPNDAQFMPLHQGLQNFVNNPSFGNPGQYNNPNQYPGQNNYRPQ